MTLPSPRPKRSPTPTAAGLLFSANKYGKKYLSSYHHRGKGNQKHKHNWSSSITPIVECGLFDKADGSKWSDHRSNYWGVIDNGRIKLGSQGEVICKFPSNHNSRDPWHGFPISPLLRGPEDQPPDDFIEWWIDNQFITKTLGRRIQRGKV